MTVYLDMDGVLADFDGGLADRGFFIEREHNRLFKQNVDKSQWTETELKDDKIVQGYMEEKGFFRNLRMIPGADKLWAEAGRPVVLTARPKKEDPDGRVASEKRGWIEEYFGEIPEDRFICCLRSEKKQYATYLGKFPNILVDDLEWNCSEWKKAGGYAILFKNSEQAVEELKKAKQYVYGERIDCA